MWVFSISHFIKLPTHFSDKLGCSFNSLSIMPARQATPDSLTRCAVLMIFAHYSPPKHTNLMIIELKTSLKALNTSGFSSTADSSSCFSFLEMNANI
jgi:hypothetical protein